MNKSIKTITRIYLSTLAVLQLSRVLFIVTYFEQTFDIGFIRILNSIAHGFIPDLTIAAWVTLPILGVEAASSLGGGSITSDPMRRLVRVYLICIAAAIAAVTTIDINLFGYWGYRLDATILPYLATPAEAAASISIKDISLGALLFAIAFVPSLLLYAYSTKEENEEQRGRLHWLSMMTLVAIIVSATSIGSFIKPHFSAILISNQIAQSPIHTLATTLNNGEISGEQYKYFDTEEELDMYFNDYIGSHTGQPVPILTTKRPNIAIIICESYSRSIMDLDTPKRGASDSTAVMPNLRRIAAEGISLERVIASGTRTDKGLVSILSGFVSQPQISILNYPEKSAKLPSLASALGREGYSSSFYYGGNIGYMNMRQYLSGTGWQNLVDNKSVESTTESQQRWGWSDAVMMDRFANDLISMSKSERPFISTLLTLSSHEPFDTPQDMGFEEPLFNAMAYSDAELGQLYDRLRESDAWDNLLLIVVADHATNYPSDLSYNAPARHHIPLIFGGGAVERPTDVRFFDTSLDEAFSQYDIAATILSQMEIDHTEFTFSRDIFDIYNNRSRYAYYTFNNGFGVVKRGGSTLFDATNSVAGVIFNPIGAKATYTRGGLLTPSDWSHLKIGKCLLQRTFVEIEKL